MCMKGERTPTEMQVDSDVTQANSRSGQRASAKTRTATDKLVGETTGAIIRGTDEKMLVDVTETKR